MSARLGGRGLAVAAALAALATTLLSAPAPAAQPPESGGPAVPSIHVRFSLARASSPTALLTSGPSQGPALLQRPRDALQDPWRKPGPALIGRPGPRRPLRAWLELGAFSAVSSVNYWVRDAFPEDKDFRLTLEDQFERIVLLEGWRFDSNEFGINWTHLLAGAVHYQFGRTNGLSWRSSWLMALTGSAWWEVVAETREVISLNDLIMTGLGGFAAGEPWYQIGHFLSHERGVLAGPFSFLNPAVKLNHWLDRNVRAEPGEVLSPWHDFSLFAGARRLATDRGGDAVDAFFGFHTRLLGLTEYRAAGDVSRRLGDTYFCEISLDYAARGGRAEETRFFTKAVTLGRLVQKIGPSGDGTSFAIGLGSAFELFKKRPVADYDAAPVPVWSSLERLRLDEPRRFTDKLAVLHVAGPVLDWMVFKRDLRLWTTVEAYGDFALVNAFALNEYSRLHEIVGLKTTVFYYGYYYGLGASASAALRLDGKGFRVEGQAMFSGWRSVDALDRFQAEVTNNAGLSDARTRFRLGAGWRIPRTPVELFVEVETVRRAGRLAEVRSTGWERKTYAGLAYSF